MLSNVQALHRAVNKLRWVACVEEKGKVFKTSMNILRESGSCGRDG